MWNQVTVVVPTYNANPAFLREALDSLANQTLEKPRFEIIVVDDASTDPAALELLQELHLNSHYQGVRLRVIRHETNQWLAQARTTGAEAASTPFIQFLDDDDWLAPDYLEKCLLLLTATPDAAWVYTNVLKFGQRNEFYKAVDFKFSRQFFRNDTPYSSLFRRDVWLEVGQRQTFLNETTRLFEDWDAYIRLAAKGHFGVANTDTTFHYRRSETGLAYRTVREYAATIYLMYRLHFWRLAAMPLGWFRFRRFLRQGRADLRAFSPVRFFNRGVQRFAARHLNVYEFPTLFTGRMIRLAVTKPERFVDELVNDRDIASLAAMRSGFQYQPDMSFTNENPFPDAQPSRSVLAAHIWWQMGGAENIYLHWLREAKEAGADAIYEVVQMTDEEQDVLKADFGEVADNQYAFDGFGQTPMQHMRGLWNLICLKRPKVIFISSNSYLYYLAPHIKREFPGTAIIDILHNEFDGIVDWFSISSDFDDSLDTRIVTSDYWKKLLVQKYGVKASKVVVADNPVDTDLYDPDRFERDEVCEDLGLDPAKKVITFIGRLHPQKGLDVFLALAKKMSDRRDYQFVIAGDGEFRSDVIDAEKRMRNLHYVGYFPTVERVLAATDVLVCPSLYEGAPLIGLECAAMNTALIAPDIVGFSEQLADGQFGVTYDASVRVHEDALTIQRILEDDLPGLIQRGKNGRAWAVGRHSVPVVGSLYRSVLGSLLVSPIAPKALQARGRPRLTLHIGLPKTGTTTIQSTLLANREVLARAGILYPLLGLNGPGHAALASSYLGEKERTRGVFANPVISTDTAEKIFDEMQTSGASRVIVSAEAFSHIGEKRVDSFLAEWTALFDVDIIMSLRRQDLLIESLHAQNYLVRFADFDRNEFLDVQCETLDFNEIVRVWAERLGRDRVTLLEYPEDGGDLLHAFLTAADLAECDLEPAQSENIRRDRNKLDFVQHHTTLVHGTDRHRELLAALDRFDLAAPAAEEHRHFYSPAERASVLEWCHEGNTKLSNEFFAGKLFADVPDINRDEPWEPFPGLRVEQIASIESFLADSGLKPSDYRDAT